jgi:6-pyruvoyltetrahydropterin/6-carboxytetrahydropterin synthase
MQGAPMDAAGPATLFSAPECCYLPPMPPARTCEIEKTFTFEAAHRLPRLPPEHKCHRLHGHSFRVVVRVRGPLDPELGWVVDFARLEDAWRPLFEQLDHRCLNDVEGLENPTSEMLASWILDRFEVPGTAVTSVHVAETCRSACTVYA